MATAEWPVADAVADAGSQIGRACGVPWGVLGAVLGAKGELGAKLALAVCTASHSRSGASFCILKAWA